MIQIEDKARIDVASENLETAIESAMVVAKYRYGAYQNFIIAGFTEEQAFELVKKDMEVNK